MSELPKEIYLQWDTDFEEHEQEITWCVHKQNNYDTKYTRADNTTLIEKLDGMKRDIYSKSKIIDAFDRGYNQALQDAIDLIKEQKNEN